MASEESQALNLSATASTTSTPRESLLCYHFSGVHFGVNSTPTPYIVNAALNVPVSFTAVAGNALILRSFWQTKALHSPSHLLLCNMALVDLSVGLLAQPFFVASLIARASSLSGMFCLTALSYDVVSTSLAAVALFTITAIFSDKYASVCQQSTYDGMVTQRKTMILVIILWMLGPFGGAMWLWHRNAFFAVCSAAICICLPIITVAHFKIYRFTKRQKEQISSEEETTPSTKSQTPKKRAPALQNLLVFFLLLVCYFPYLCTFIIIGVSDLTPVRQSVFEFANTLVFIKSSLNPFIMCWGFQDVQVAVFTTARTYCRRKPGAVSPNTDSEGQPTASAAVPLPVVTSYPQPNSASTKNESCPHQGVKAPTTPKKTLPPETTDAKTAKKPARATAACDKTLLSETTDAKTATPNKTLLSDTTDTKKAKITTAAATAVTIVAAAIPAKNRQKQQQQHQEQEQQEQE